MDKIYFFTIGWMFIGVLIPEVIAAYTNRTVPTGMNVICSMGFGLIAYSSYSG